MNDKTPCEFLAIQLAAEERAQEAAPGVTVIHGQGQLYFDGEGARAAKAAVGAFLLRRYPHRKFNHVKHRGRRVWWVRDSSGNAICKRRGIEVVKTDGELSSVILGPVTGVNCI